MSKSVVRSNTNKQLTSADMTLRDHFAIAALSGMLAGSEDNSLREGTMFAYLVADHMLKSRSMSRLALVNALRQFHSSGEWEDDK